MKILNTMMLCTIAVIGTWAGTVTNEAGVVYTIGPKSDLSNTDLSNLDLSGTDLNHSNLKGANFSNANLANANLSYCMRRGADFSNANISNANLRHGFSESVNFSGAILVGVNFDGSNLSGANFSGADVRGTYLESVKETTNSEAAAIHSNSSFAEFGKGGRVNPEPASTLRFYEIPKVFRAFEVEQIKNASTVPLIFEVEKGGTVFVVAEKSTSKILIQDGWEIVDQASVATPETMEHFREIPILAKAFEAGEYTIPFKRSRFGCRLLRPARHKEATVAPQSEVVGLCEPYPKMAKGSPTDRISVVHAASILSHQAGLKYDWKQSYKNTDPYGGRWTYPQIKDKPFDRAMFMLLEPFNLTYKIEDGVVVLCRP